MANIQQQQTAIQANQSPPNSPRLSPTNPGVAYEAPTPWQRNRKTVYEIAKIFQICVCFFFIIVGIIMCFYNIFSDHNNDDDWFWWPRRQRRRYRYRERHDYNFYFNDFWYSYLFANLWFHVMTSVCGLIGATGEVLWCQIVYAIMMTLSISLTLYCPVPWLIVVGIIEEWGKPFYYAYNV